MINFRFHLVSLVAVFLALTIGIVVGATIGNQAIVNSLKRQIDRVQKDTNAQRDRNHLLSTTNDQLGQSLESLAPFVVEGRLTAVPVVVIAEHGVDRDTVRELVTLLQDAGAQSPAIVWMQSKWLLTNATDRARLATIVGAPGSLSSLRAEGLDALATRLGTAVTVPATAATTTTTTGSAEHGDVLSELTSAGFVTVDPIGASGTTDLSTFPTAGARVVVLGGSDSDLASKPTLPTLVDAFASHSVPTIAGELDTTSESASARGTTLASIIADSRLSQSVSTVDDVDLEQGRITVVLATEESGQAQFGHYGYGKGADRALPLWTGS